VAVAQWYNEIKKKINLKFPGLFPSPGKLFLKVVSSTLPNIRPGPNVIKLLRYKFSEE